MSIRRIPAATRLPPYVDPEDDLSVEYPASDDEPMAETPEQYIALTNTVAALMDWFRDRSDVYVAGDMFVYYRMNDNEARVAPDVYVVFGARGNHLRHSWITWREDKAPDFVLEIASPSTWRRDANEKRDIYAGMGVTEYWRFDPIGLWLSPSPALIAEELADGEYRAIPLTTDNDGVLRAHSPLLGLDVCVLPGLELRLYDPEGGQWLYTPQESADARRTTESALEATEAARQTAMEQRDTAITALDAANERIRQLEAELERRPRP